MERFLVVTDLFQIMEHRRGGGSRGHCDGHAPFRLPFADRNRYATHDSHKRYRYDVIYKKRGMQYQSLNGQWQFRELGDDRWFDANVPGGVYSDLFAAGEIPDPYHEDNELDLQWVGKTDWVYNRTVHVESDFLDHGRVRLRCKGLDTVATVAVNDEVVGSSDNMHRSYDFDVADALEPGENEITVTFRSPVKYGIECRDAHPYEVPTLRYPIDQPAVNFIRKAQCHYGWDWGPCLPTVGIWRDIELVAYSAPAIEYVTTQQDHGDGTIEVAATVGIDAPSSTTTSVSASVADVETAETVELAEGSNEVSLTLAVDDPELWWPNGHGDQPLYDFDVSVSNDVGTDTVTERVGFRELEVVRELDAGGESFRFEVNGEPIFAKGANWIPMDALYGRITEGRYAELLGDAAAVNMNMIRVWGGGYYERDTFYDYCDELGLLVWQDFMFACSLYPADDEFIATVEAEARDQVRRLVNHASLALWCGNNENEEALANWFSDVEHIDVLRSDYDRLYLDTLGEVVSEEDPGRTYWSASPSSGEDVEEPYQMDRGDVHYWDVWHKGAPFSDYELIEPRFVSEFGYQSFPPTDVLRESIPPEQLNPTAPLMEHHQRHENGNSIILQQMADAFRMPSSFDDFVYLSQIQQGLAMQIAIEHFRRLQPHCMGALYWQLNDLWPCASWSSIAYGGDWKALQYMARRIYAPALVSIVAPDGDEARSEGDSGRTTTRDGSTANAPLEVWLTNDDPDALRDELVVEVVSLDGSEHVTESYDVYIDGYGSEAVATVDSSVIGATPDEMLVRASYRGSTESYPAFWFGEKYKRLSLPATDVRTDVSGSTVTVRAETAALFVALDAGSIEGSFSDNYFHLAPNEERTVTFDATDTTGLDDELSVTHLYETY